MLMRQNKSSVELIDLSSNTCFHKVFARNIVLTESAKMDTANIDNWYLNNQQSKHYEIGIGTCTWKHISLTDTGLLPNITYKTLFQIFLFLLRVLNLNFVLKHTDSFDSIDQIIMKTKLYFFSGLKYRTLFSVKET